MEQSLALLPLLKDISGTVSGDATTSFSAQRLVTQLLRSTPDIFGLLSGLFPSISSADTSFLTPPTLYGVGDCVAQIVQRMKKQLDEGSPIRFAIVGPPAIGKSSIASAVAHSDIVLAHFLDGRYRVPCQDVSSIDAFYHILQDTFRLILPRSLQTRGADIHTIVTALRKQNRPQLIILDGFETIWDVAEIRNDIQCALQQICSIPNLALLITMRGTETPSVIEWKQEIQPFSPRAARLAFLSRYQGRDDHLEELLKAVDHVPLAVTLLAQYGQANAITPLELLGLLGAKATESLNSDEEPLHPLQSLDASIRSSLESNTMKSNVAARQLLTILSMLPGGLALSALQDMLSNVSGSLEKVSSTVTNASLAFVLPSERLQLLSPIRSYVLRYHQLDEETRQTLYSYYFRQAERGMCRRGDKNTLSIVRSLNEEEHNMVAILDDALDHQCTVAIKAMLQYSTLLCSITPHLRVMKKALTLARESGLKELLAPCLQRLGEMNGVIGQYFPAHNLLREAITLYQQLGDDLGAARCMMTHGGDLYRCGGKVDGLRFLEQAYLDFSRLQDLPGQAECLLRLGEISICEGPQKDDRRAVKDGHRAIQDALAIFRELDDSLGVAKCQLVSTQLHLEVSDRPALENILKCVEQFGDHASTADCLILLSHHYRKDGRHDDSRIALERALELREKLGRRLDAAFCMKQLADHYLSHDCFDKAIPLLESAVEEFWSSAFVFAGAGARLQLGYVYMKVGQFNKALLTLEIARRELVRNEEKHKAAHCQLLRYHCLKRAGQHEDAADLIAESSAELIKHGLLRLKEEH